MSFKPRPGYDEPITDVCIVSNPDSALPGFDIVRSTRDTHDDCNLWPDSFFSGRTSRYLCFSRRVQHKFWSDSDKVLVDILMNPERDIPPTGFTMIHHTRDTGEKATKKRVICVKMKPRSSATICICEVIMVTHMRNIPRAFNVKGEINGKTLCVRLISVLPSPLPLEKLPSPLLQQSQKQSLPPVQRLSMETGYNPPHPTSSQYDPYRQQAVRHSMGSSISNPTELVSPSGSYNPPPPSLYSMDPKFSGLKLRFSILPDMPLKDIPFVLDEDLLDLEKARQVMTVDVSYRSPVDLDNEYSYTFQLEELVVRRGLPSTRHS